MSFVSITESVELFCSFLYHLNGAYFYSSPWDLKFKEKFIVGLPSGRSKNETYFITKLIANPGRIPGSFQRNKQSNKQIN